MTQRWFSALLPAALLAVVALIPLPADARSENPFEDLKGSWRGGGTLSPLGGDQERVSCRATYNVSGSSTAQVLTCAGTDYKVTTSANLNVSGGGNISGSWSESLTGASGSVSGIAKSGSIHARLNGDKFSGRMSISVSGNSHSINISQFDAGSGRYRPVANVSFRR